MNSRLIKISHKLKAKKFFKLAQKVLDLSKKFDQKKQQEDLLKKTKEDLRMEEILRQHQKDKPYLRFPSEDPKSFVPPSEQPAPYRGRWEVHIQYPSFDEKGAPYFDHDSISDFITISEDQLRALEEEAKMGYIKIVSKRFLLPKSRLK